ncbi:uncharacterized protein [Nicotiana sylvestris]
MSLSDKFNEAVVKKLMEILKVNPYSTFLKSLTDIPELSDFYIALKSNSGLDQRTYNLPTPSEVGAIWIEEQTNNKISTPHIRIYTHSNRSQLLPSILNMTSIDGLLDMESEVLSKDRYKLLTPEAYDKFVCAELPDRNLDSSLYSLVTKHMIHGPCGYLNPSNSFMKKDHCKFKYPKELAEYTAKGKNSYPIYRSRQIEIPVEVRGYNIDNYNPFLLKKFNCHINVEICSDIKVVKYLYKYICKGHDKIAFFVHGDNTNVHIDEIKEYQSARWVSPPEAACRLFVFPISEMTPSVMQLQLHLEGQQFVSFKTIQNIHQIVNNPMTRRTILTEFFVMNSTNKDAKALNLLYKEFPEYFVWSPTDKIWSRRQRGTAIGRIVTCHPTEGERYYLRLLLMNVRGPKSYADLCNVNGKCCDSFREAAEKRGLLHCDNNLIDFYCNPANPRELWEKFEEPMSQNFKRIPNLGTKRNRHLVLNHINEVLHSMGHNIYEFKFTSEIIVLPSPANEAKDVQFERNIIVSEEDLLLEKKLNSEQRRAYNIILDRVYYDKPGAFFIDGPGGTGKIFLYRALLANIRSKDFIALATASSGVATSILPGGRTAHSCFKISIDIDENFTCNISKQTALATLIQDSKLIVWDEVLMAKKKMIEAFNTLLKDLMNTNILFGGKVVVFGGDFRQTLPVIRSGKKEDFICESLLYSDIWNDLEKLCLSENMRAKEDPAFSRSVSLFVGLLHCVYDD